MPFDYQNLLTRKTLERFKWALCVSVPIWFGYGFARDPANLEWVKRVFPTAASERQGHGADQLNTLEDELNRFILERKIDRALEEVKKRKGASAGN